MKCCSYRRDDEDLKISVQISDLLGSWGIGLTFEAPQSARTINVIPSYAAPSEQHKKLKDILPTSQLPHSATLVEQALILTASEAVSEWVEDCERGSDQYNRLMHLQADVLFDWWVSPAACVLLGESLRSRSPQRGRASS